MGHYTKEFKQKMVRLHIEESRSLQSLSNEFNVSKSGISNWVKRYREECQSSPAAQDEYDLMKENQQLRKRLEEAEKENLYLKKAAAFFAKEVK